MELAFRDPIKNTHGDVKFPAGVFFEWPRSTFQQIARTLGKPLEAITVTKEEAGALIAGGSSSMKRKTVGSTKRARLRLQE